MTRWWAVLLAMLVLRAQPPVYDWAIRGATVVDGTGAPRYTADVFLAGGRIAAIGNVPGASARREVDARGLTLTPGFIDVHSHGLAGLLSQEGAAENYIRQGVTTIFEGPDGGSPLPIAPMLEKLAALRPMVHIGLFVGHGTVRSRVMGSVNRAATPEELDQMRGLVRQAMREGAFGLSTGLFYVPGNFAPTEELVELAKVAGAAGGIHQSHMRDEAERVADSVRETLRIGEEGRLPTQITHHKVIGKRNWGLSQETLRLVDEARRRGVDVSIDQYPYTASSTGTAALFPQWALEGGAKALAERLSSSAQRARIQAEIVRRLREDRGAGDPANVVLAGCRHDPSLAGRNLAELASQRRGDASFENAAEVAIELQLAGGCSAIYHAISEEDIERIMRHPATMIASDGGVPSLGQGHPHPRNYGTFARVLSVYVQARGVLTLEEAVHKMSGLPARRMGLRDRGLIRAGQWADLALFDPAAVRDRSTFADPHHYAEGMRIVWVRGTPALENGVLTGERAGEVLRGSGAPQ
jgi:dihydroorotase/N-acyl-D-amino-acid deacylase